MSNNKKTIKIIVGLFVAGIIIVGSIVFYLFNMPHRNVQDTKADAAINVEQIVNEYIANAEQANAKYLDAEGESKILEVTGIVNEISEDFNGQQVVLLKVDKLEAGVSCTFTPETNESVLTINVGDKIVVKGVIRSGASYDEDLEMYEHVIMEKCSIAS